MFSDDVRKSRDRERNQKEASNALRCPCFNHALNINFSVLSSVVSIQNSIRVIKETIAFLTSSAKQRVVVDSNCVRKIKKTLRNKMGRAGRNSCRFFYQFEAIIDVLDEIPEWEDTNASSKAKTLTSSLTNFEFLISLHCQVSVLDFFAFEQTFPKVLS
jgi:hypothetical protein